MNEPREHFECFVKAKYGSSVLRKQDGSYADRITERMFQAYLSACRNPFKNGTRLYVTNSDRFVGLFVGVNPSTGSIVCFDESSGEYRSFHAWQIEDPKQALPNMVASVNSGRP